MNDAYLPQGVFAFYNCSVSPNVGCGVLDVWPEPGARSLVGIGQSRRLKFAIQYNRVVFGVALVDHPAVTFVAVEGLHAPVFSNASTVTYRPVTSDLLDVGAQLAAAGLDANEANFLLTLLEARVGVD